MRQTCPSCGTESGGRFCSDCGAVLAAECRECGTPIAEGGRFCGQCGTAAAPVAQAAAATRRDTILPWAVAAAAVVVIGALVVIPRISGSPSMPAAPMAGPLGEPGVGAPAVDLASMSPRERADRLFNRVMEGVAQGDTAQLDFFADMAIQAYAMVPERDADLHYHLAELHRVRGEAGAVQAQADSILAGHPTHLFGLFSAARAAELRGDRTAAAALFRSFVDAYPDEVARDLPEYREHVQGLPAMRAEAVEATGRR